MKRIRAELKEAAKHPIVYTDDCPESTPDVLEKYKSLGNGYTGIMADVLKLAADNPEILRKVHIGQ